MFHTQFFNGSMSSADSFSISSKRSSAAFSLTRLSVPLCSGTVGGGGGFETPGLEFGVRAFVSSWDLEGRAKSRAKMRLVVRVEGRGGVAINLLLGFAHWKKSNQQIH